MSAKIGAAFLATCAVALAAAGPAVANDPTENWMRFPGAAYASTSDPSRSRLRPRVGNGHSAEGLPNAGAANIAATQSAIKRYTAIVAEGGWADCPDVQVRSGSNGPAVVLLRQRLLVSGDLRERRNPRASTSTSRKQ